MIQRILASFLLKLFIDLPMMLLGYLVVPVALRYEHDNHLPWWAEWAWGNADHGNDGESFWAKRTVGWSRFRRCFWWLVVRNPTFNWTHLWGLRIKDQSRAILEGNPDIGDKKAGGWYWLRMGWAWEFYYIRPFTIFGHRRCVRFRAGWKIKGRDAGEIAQFVFAINPIHPYFGK